MAPENDAARRDFLSQRSMRFFNRYGGELESVGKLLHVRLDQLALAYALDHSLPREAVAVTTRIKSLDSFLKKLAKKGWPDFYYPTEVAGDIVGARVVCWFLDDCYGMLELLRRSQHFRVRQDSVEDYIEVPKPSGYRSIHLLVDVSYDRVKKVGDQRIVAADTIVCEIQIRTKLQDAWGEFTHEMHYKVPGRFESDYETLVAEIAHRLASEDKSALALRNILQRQVEKKEREGLRGA